MAAIYIVSDYGKMTKRDETLVFVQNDETERVIFPFKTEHLVIMGNISISGAALRLLMKYKIGTTFLSSNGRFNGKLTFGDSKNVFLRQKQYQILSDEKASLEIARSIVLGKIRNQISFIQRIKRKDSAAVASIVLALADVKNALAGAESAESIDKVRGFEGNAARAYFSVFGCNIQPDWAEFKKRSKNPPLSNVNAVLSFLYALVMYRVESALESQGLDVYAGNLHAINYGKLSLTFDMMEEFRVPIADTLCCALFNLGTLKESDFEKKEFSSGDSDFPLEESAAESDTAEAVLLTKDGLKKVIAAFETKMDSLVFYAPSNERISYKKIIYEQARHYKRVISGEETDYKPYYFK